MKVTRDKILKLLKGGRWMTGREIRNVLDNTYGGSIPVTYFAHVVSKLRYDGLVIVRTDKEMIDDIVTTVCRYRSRDGR